MIRIGITGQAGFIGTHLYNTLGLYPDDFERIPFEDDYYNDEKRLKEFAAECDTIVHLAAMNRHGDPQVIYDTNIRLVKQLIDACEQTRSTPHILFSSSTQEERDNLYGKSKKDGRKLFEQWAAKNQAKFTGLVIPNVYGPFGHPYYNSVVATFCHQLTHDEQPKIKIDGHLKLIYVNDLVVQFIEMIRVETRASNSSKKEDLSKTLYIPHSAEIKVSALLNELRHYQQNYYEKGIIPNLDDTFKRNLFNTFVCFIEHISFYPFPLSLNSDYRGSFVETIKLNSGGQVSFSTTKPGITRGNHFHIRKAERFVVIKGRALIEMRRIGTGKVLSFELDGKMPSFVDMPIWYTHNITNIGDEDLYTFFWISEHFDQNDPDTYLEKV